MSTETRQFASKSPEAIQAEIDALNAPYQHDLDQATEQLRTERERQIASRSRSIFGKLLNGLDISRDSHKLKVQDAERPVHRKYSAIEKLINTLEADLRFSEFERKPIPYQTRAVELAGWNAIYERPKTINKYKVPLNKRRNEIVPGGHKLDLSFGVSVELPSLGINTLRQLRFVGPRIYERRPEMDEWQQDRGIRAGNTVYLTDVYGDGNTAPEEPFTLQLDHFHLGQLTASERWDIIRAGNNAALEVKWSNFRDRQAGAL